MYAVQALYFTLNHVRYGEIFNDYLVMAALWNRTGHYILSYGFYLLSFFLLFPRLISAVADWMSTIHLHILRLQNAGLKCAARGSFEIQDAKYRSFVFI